jgi:hypothetical protein
MKYSASFRPGCRNPAAKDGKLWATASPVVTLEFHVLVTGCIWGIHAPNPSGGEAVQIGCPADLSGIQAGMTAF